MRISAAVVLAAFLFIAIGTSLIYERRAFCRYLCPVGGFIGLYSQLAPTEVRVISTSVRRPYRENLLYRERGPAAARGVSSRAGW